MQELRREPRFESLDLTIKQGSWFSWWTITPGLPCTGQAWRCRGAGAEIWPQMESPTPRTYSQGERVPSTAITEFISNNGTQLNYMRFTDFWPKSLLPKVRTSLRAIFSIITHESPGDNGGFSSTSTSIRCMDSLKTQVHEEVDFWTPVQGNAATSN